MIGSTNIVMWNVIAVITNYLTHNIPCHRI